MADATRLVSDDAHEDMGASYQCVQVAILDAALLEHGISDVNLRREVCHSFVFNMGNFHDQGWFKITPDARPIFPLLCFSERFLNLDTRVEGIGAVHAPSSNLAYHESASGGVDGFFEGDPVFQIETGFVGPLDDD